MRYPGFRHQTLINHQKYT